MNPEKIEQIRQKHLKTKNALKAEAEKKEQAHKAAVDAFCEKILHYLYSDEAYDDSQDDIYGGTA